MLTIQENHIQPYMKNDFHNFSLWLVTNMYTITGKVIRFKKGINGHTFIECLETGSVYHVESGKYVSPNITIFVEALTKSNKRGLLKLKESLDMMSKQWVEEKTTLWEYAKKRIKNI
jgi:hypothetical protein